MREHTAATVFSKLLTDPSCWLATTQQAVLFPFSFSFSCPLLLHSYSLCSCGSALCLGQLWQHLSHLLPQTGFLSVQQSQWAHSDQLHFRAGTGDAGGPLQGSGKEGALWHQCVVERHRSSHWSLPRVYRLYVEDSLWINIIDRHWFKNSVSKFANTSLHPYWWEGRSVNS